MLLNQPHKSNILVTMKLKVLNRRNIQKPLLPSIGAMILIFFSVVLCLYSCKLSYQLQLHVFLDIYHSIYIYTALNKSSDLYLCLLQVHMFS